MRKIKKILFPLAMIVGALALAGCLESDKTEKETKKEVKEVETIDESTIKKSTYKSGVAVHDPSVIEVDGTFYIFGSHGAVAKSTNNMLSFTPVADGINKNNKIWSNLFVDGKPGPAFNYVKENEGGGYAFWAPDVIFNKTLNKYVMYYCSTYDYRTSSIGYGISDNIEGPYELVEPFLYSGFTKDGTHKIKDTNVEEILGDKAAEYIAKYSPNAYNNQVYPNALDPAVFYDENDKMWMVYGSWSGGIFVLEIDPATNRPIYPTDEQIKEDPANIDPYFGTRIVGGGGLSIEAPYMLFDKEAGYYYLFVSYGSLNREGGYQIRMYRSDKPNGTFVDASGQSWLGNKSTQITYGVKMIGNYKLPSLVPGYKAPGHNSATITSNGEKLLVFHTRFDNNQEWHEPRTHQLFTNEDGWLVTAPYIFRGEKISETGYEKKELVGTYFVVNHGIAINADVSNSVQVSFNEDGTFIGGNYEGTWEVKENTPYVTLNVKGMGKKVDTFKGVFVKMQDEAGTECMNFTVIGENNISMWGTKY